MSGKVVRFGIGIWWDFQSHNSDKAKITSWHGGLLGAPQRGRRIKEDKELETLVSMEPVCHPPSLLCQDLSMCESTEELLGPDSALLDSWSTSGRRLTCDCQQLLEGGFESPQC